MKTLPLFKNLRVGLTISIIISFYFQLDIFLLNTFEPSFDSSLLVGCLAGIFSACLVKIFNLNKVFFKYNNQKILWKLDVEKEIQEANIDCISNIKEDWKSVYFENNDKQYEIGTTYLTRRQKRTIVNLLKDFASHNPK